MHKILQRNTNSSCPQTAQSPTPNIREFARSKMDTRSSIKTTRRLRLMSIRSAQLPKNLGTFQSQSLKPRQQSIKIKSVRTLIMNQSPIEDKCKVRGVVARTPPESVWTLSSSLNSLTSRPSHLTSERITNLPKPTCPQSPLTRGPSSHLNNR